MKKIVSVLCTFALALSMFSVPVFAASAEKASDTEAVQVVNGEGEVSPASVTTNPKDLYNVRDYLLINQDVQNITVQPTEGRHLRMWISTNAPLNITCEYTNVFGLWHGCYETNIPAGEQDLLLATYCNGKEYRISIRTSSWATYSLKVYETDDAS